MRKTAIGVLTLAANLMVASFVTPSSAADNAITLTAESAQSLSSQAGAAALLAKASAKGKVRVIAGLSLPLADEGSLSTAAAAGRSQFSGSSRPHGGRT